MCIRDRSLSHEEATRRVGPYCGQGACLSTEASEEKETAQQEEEVNELALFAGAGGGILGGKILGWRTVCAVEYEEYAAGVLIQRQNDGLLPPFPVWDDVRTFDGKPWRGTVDVVSGGFPCQDISAAGKGAGLDGERSGLWREMARIISEVRPRFVFVENSPILTSRGLGVVLGDLAEMGFDAEWCVLSAADCGAQHLRERIWILADASSGRCGQSCERQVEQQGRTETISASDAGEAVAHTDRNAGIERRQSNPQERARGRHADRSSISTALANANGAGPLPCSYAGVHRCQEGGRAWHEQSERFSGWPTEPGVGRVVDGMATRVERIRAIGNGQVPRVAAAAFSILLGRLRDSCI
jgi:DNA (cytosine-5)-methyltransferase 1